MEDVEAEGYGLPPIDVVHLAKMGRFDSVALPPPAVSSLLTRARVAQAAFVKAEPEHPWRPVMRSP